MPLNTKTIKRRIKSVGSTKKITKAMEMISAVKMRRAVAAASASRSYAAMAWEMLANIAEKTRTPLHPLMAARPAAKVGLLLITSNRGLAGGFSSRLLQKAHAYIQDVEADKNTTVDVILLGRRGRNMHHRFGHRVAAEFEKIDLCTRIEEMLPLAASLIEGYRAGTYDRVVLGYTDYISALSQLPCLKQLLPIARGSGEGSEATENHVEYIFEPSPQEALQSLMPRLAEMQIYQAVLESDASEHSARMLAMANASDAATDMIDELARSYNKARQAAITQEISEIVGGAAALA